MWYTKIYRDCIRSASEERDSKNKQKIWVFLLISANKDSLRSGVQIYF